MNKIKSSKVITAAMMGNALEYYDFTLFVFLSPILGPLFFPAEDKITSIILALGTYAVGYFMRPLGAIIFGHIGDKYGRKQALTIAILAMAIPTALMGALPTYAAIGIAAPVLLIGLRAIQGFCTGGEYNGAGIFVVENVEPHKAGFSGGMITASSAIGALMGSIVASICTLANMPSWAWRVAFLLGIVVGIIGFYIRRKMSDVYLAEMLTKKKPAAKFPLREVITKNPASVFCTMGIAAFAGIMYNLSLSYVSVFLTAFQNWPPSEALFVMSFGTVAYIILAPLSGWLSDKFGGTKVLVTGAIATLIGLYPFLSLLSSSNVTTVIIAQLALVVLAAWFHGPMNLFMASLFKAETRYSGLAFGYSVGMAIFGGTTSMIATFLTSWTGNPLAPAFYGLFGGALGLISVLVASNRLSVRKDFSTDSGLVDLKQAA